MYIFHFKESTNNKVGQLLLGKICKPTLSLHLEKVWNLEKSPHTRLGWIYI